VKHVGIYEHLAEFRPVMTSRTVQAAIMSLRSGESSSNRIENEHPRAEQWLFVVSGTGVGRLGTRRVRLKKGDLILIPKKVPHQITNTGRARLVTLNLYAPPAYTRQGDVKPSVTR
jgi:mannose-6-phosphate isomerase-like protein (cupin superfamily)